MIDYIIVYIVIGLIAGIIDDESEKKKNLSFTLMIIGAIISFLTNGIFIIAAIIEMAIGYLIIVKIKSFFKNTKKINPKSKIDPQNETEARHKTLERLAKAARKRPLVNWAIQFNISDIINNQENLENIVKLDLSNKNLTYLPSEINCLKNLRSLNCNSNKLTLLPTSIIDLHYLTELNLYNNKITSLPSNIGSMKNLSILSLSKNDLSYLPESIINLKSLKKLQLVENELLEISENQRLWIQGLIYNKIDVKIDNRLLINKNDKDINVRNILKKAMDDVESNQSILVKSQAENIIEKVEEAKIIQNPSLKKRGLRIVKKASSEKNVEKNITEFIDKELDKLKQELKTLENRLHELTEQKTEYLTDIEDFNALYNLHLGELLENILNLKKEILYKQTIQQQENRKKFEENIEVFNSTKENIEEIRQTIEEFEKVLEDIDKNDEIYANYKELQDELEKLEKEIEEQEENLSKTKEEIQKDKVFEEYEESKKQYEQFHQNYEDIKQQQSDVFDITNEQKNELKKLWKKACKLCHPDIVIDKFKGKAHELMQALNDAYSKKDIVKVQEILSNLENGLTFEIESDNINDKEILKSKINQYKKNILDLESEIEDLKQDETYQTIQEIDDMDEYFEELKSELQNEKDKLENEAKDILYNTEKKNIKESIKKSTPKKKTKSKIESENSQYSKYIQSIENPNFEKIRRYCNNLLNDNQADEMQKYLAENGKMHKAIIYDALEQFISKLDKKTITLVDLGCEQGIGSMLVLDYIKEKQLDIVVNQIVLVDNKTDISRAISQVEPLKQNDIEIITVRSNDISELEKLKDIKNNIILNLIVNDKFPVDYLDIDYELFKNSYFMCVSNSNKNFVDEIYENISDFGSVVENLSIRDSKIGRFKKYERIFKILNSNKVVIANIKPVRGKTIDELITLLKSGEYVMEIDKNKNTKEEIILIKAIDIKNSVIANIKSVRGKTIDELITLLKSGEYVMEIDNKEEIILIKAIDNR